MNNLLLIALFLCSVLLHSQEKIIEDIFEYVPFSIVEEVPVYPGCKGTNVEKKACLSKSLQKHSQRYFDVVLGNELGLSPGKKRIYVQFKIDKDGSITDINVRSPHQKLREEAIRVVKMIPKIIPGKQKGEVVRVGYTLPIIFNVE